MALSWGASTGGTKVEGYRVLRGPVGATLTVQNLIGTTDAVASYTASHLYSGTSYQFGIVAIDVDGNQSAARTVTVTTSSSSDTSAPSAATNVTLTPFSSTRIDIIWTASTSTNATGYLVFRDGTQVGSVDRPAASRFSDNGLAASSTHSYTIQTVSSNHVVSAATSARSAATLAVGTAKIVRGPLLERVTATSAEVSWWTNVPTQSVVSYGVGAYSATITNSSPVLQHVVQLPSLLAGTTYQYKAGDGSTVSSAATFSTAAVPGASFTFAAIGDFGGGSTGEAQNATGMASDSSQFIQTVGDNIYNTSGLPDPNFATTYSDFDSRFYKPFAAAVRSRSFNPADGNGEYYGGGAFWQNFDLPNNQRWYSYDWGDAHFVVLDSEQAFDSTSAQFSWLQSDLNAHQSAAWRIVTIHRPSYSSSASCSSCRTILAPLFETEHVNLVLAGHSHNYERTFALVNGVPTTGGVTYIVTGAGGNGFNTFSTTQPSWSAFREDSYYEHLEITVSPTQLTVNAVKASDSSLFDSVVIPFSGTISGPTTPGNFQGQATGATTASLSWSASTDSSSTITGYKVYRGGALLTTVGASTLSYNDSGLTPATTYSYGVSAVDAANKESSKAITSVTTQSQAAHFLLTTPANATAGTAFQETVTAQDASNNTVTTYTGGKTLNWSGLATVGGNGPLLPANPVTFTNGVASLLSITPFAAQTTTLRVDDGTSVNGTSGTFTVAPAAASSFGLSAPGPQTAGQGFTETVTALDRYSNTVTGYTTGSGSSASIAFAQEAGATETATASTLRATISSSGGDLLVACISMYTGSTVSVSSITDSSGNTWRRIGSPLLVSGHNSRGEIWYSITTSPGSWVQANYSAAVSSAMSVLEFSGVAGLDVSAGTSNTGTSASSGATAALAGSGELSVGFAAIHSSNAAISNTASGYTATTQRNSAVTSALAGVRAAYKLNAGPATETYTATTPSVYWAAGVATFTPKSGGGGGGGTLSWSGLSNALNGTTPAIGPANFSNGVATVSITPYRTESTSLSVRDSNNVSGTSLPFSVSPGPVSTLSLINPAAQLTAGLSFDETITGKDAWDNGISSSLGLAWSGLHNSPGPSNTPPGQPLSAVFTDGSAPVSLTPYDAESTTLSVTTGTVSSLPTASFTVAPGSTASLTVILDSPVAQATSGHTGRVSAFDSWANAQTGDGAPLALTSSDTGCSTGLNGYCPSTVTLTQGQATFSFGFTDCSVPPNAAAGSGTQQSITLTEGTDPSAISGTGSSYVQPADPIVGCLITPASSSLHGYI